MSCFRFVEWNSSRVLAKDCRVSSRVAKWWFPPDKLRRHLAQESVKPACCFPGHVLYLKLCTCIAHKWLINCIHFHLLCNKVRNYGRLWSARTVIAILTIRLTARNSQLVHRVEMFYTFSHRNSLLLPKMYNMLCTILYELIPCWKLNVVDKTPISSAFLVELYVGPTHGCIFKTSIDLIFVLFSRQNLLRLGLDVWLKYGHTLIR